jgi:hypothetical protein
MDDRFEAGMIDDNAAAALGALSRTREHARLGPRTHQLQAPQVSSPLLTLRHSVRMGGHLRSDALAAGVAQ